jgi:cell wall-associated NlpC family hydrolase
MSGTDPSDAEAPKVRRNWLGRSALVLIPAAAGALTAVGVQPSPAFQASPAYHAASVASVASITSAIAATPATARLTSSAESIGNRILDKAETRVGDWYEYGGAGPDVFDCSGLVYWASRQLGVDMPRSTYDMLNEGVSSGLLYRVSTPERGDLAFYGTGHVEFVTSWRDTTFGAADTGTRVGWHTWNAYWYPTMYFRIR